MNITIIIAIDNNFKKEYLNSIESAFNQTIECNVVISCCEQWYDYINDNFKNKNILKLEDNKEIYFYFNEGFKLCKTEYVLFLHYMDDLSVDQIDLELDNIESNDAVSSLSLFRDVKGHMLCIKDKKMKHYKTEVMHTRIFNFFHKLNPLFFSSIIFKKECIKEFPQHDLYEYIILSNFLQNNNKIKVIEENLLYYTVDENRFDYFNRKYRKKCKRLKKQYKEFLDKRPFKKYNVGIVIIATYKYSDYVFDIVNSGNKYLLTDHNVHYFVFTDHTYKFRNYENITTIETPHMVWPGMTLFRYSFFWNNRDVFKDMDYLIYMDADMKFINHIGDEILGDLIGTKHAWQNVNPRSEFCYESKNIFSTAYINEEEGDTYFFGTLQGGSKDEFLKMCETLSHNIKEDIDNDIIAIWHDESHLNRYMIDHPPDVVLDASYAFIIDTKTRPDYQDYRIPKIAVVSKDNGDMRDNFKEEDLLERISQYYSSIYNAEYVDKSKRLTNSTIILFCDINSIKSITVIKLYVKYLLETIELNVNDIIYIINTNYQITLPNVFDNDKIIVKNVSNIVDGINSINNSKDFILFINANYFLNYRQLLLIDKYIKLNEDSIIIPSINVNSFIPNNVIRSKKFNFKNLKEYDNEIIYFKNSIPRFTGCGIQLKLLKNILGDCKDDKNNMEKLYEYKNLIDMNREVFMLGNDNFVIDGLSDKQHMIQTIIKRG